MTAFSDPRLQVSSTALRIVLVGMLSCAAVAASAGEVERVAPIKHGPTAKECGECHMAFQPGLLPPASWTSLMGGLADHFGQDGSLPDALAFEIQDYLAANAGRGDGTMLRITGQRWWVGEHRKISQAEWSKPQVGAKSNCPACHGRAEQGDYEDD